MLAEIPAPAIYPVAIAAVVGINGIAAWAFWWDKRLAVQRRRRISERTLLLLVMLGGFPGALLARRKFRHKTRKQPFSTMLWLIAIAETGAVIGMLVPLPGWTSIAAETPTATTGKRHAHSPPQRSRSRHSADRSGRLDHAR